MNDAYAADLIAELRNVTTQLSQIAVVLQRILDAQSKKA
jgi:hypothetical protein